VRIAFLTPGTGNYYCGVCLRDNSLARHLIDHGHEVTMLPAYLPHLLDEEAAGTKKSPVFLGGINVYLQHKFPIFRKSPKWLDNLFNSERLLRWVAGNRGMTTPRQLGEITISTLRAKDGPLAKEVNKVIDWFKEDGKPDILLLSTVLLAGIGRAVREELCISVLSFLQGEDDFLDSLLPEFRKDAWDLIGADARALDGCISPSRFFANLMGQRLAIAPQKILSLSNGISLDGYPAERDEPSEPTLGYFARICPEKGLDLLVDAFIQLKQSRKYPELKLAVAGTLPQENESFLEEQKRKIIAAGFDKFVVFRPNLSRGEKIDFLSRLTLFCVPARLPEAFGLYVIEAMAAGVPVVLPDHGSFPELINETKGGSLYAKDEPSGLVNAMNDLLSNSEQAKQYGEQGRAAVHEKYSNYRLANELVEKILAPLVSTK
jgi:glycosyltransferase involved in cell wall biosynthesis